MKALGITPPMPSTPRIKDQPAPAGHQLTDHGGPVLTEANIYILWAGTSYSYVQGDFEAFAQRIYQGYFSEITPLLRGTPFSGRYLGSNRQAPALPNPFDSSQVDAYVSAAIASGAAPAQDGKTIYVIAAPSDVATTLFGTEKQCDYFCAYHWGSSLAIVIPDNGCISCHGGWTNDNAAFSMLAHEMAETISNPHSNAWYEDGTGKETGDLVDWVPLSYGNDTLQGYFLNANGGTNAIGTYNPNAPIPTPGPTPMPTVTITPPASITAGQPATFKIAATNLPTGSTPTYYTLYGDNVYDTNWNTSPTEPHTYVNPGTYTVTAYVLDGGVEYASTSITVTVQAAPAPQPAGNKAAVDAALANLTAAWKAYAGE